MNEAGSGASYRAGNEASWLELAATKNPDKIAIYWNDEIYSFRSLADRAEGLALALSGCGLGRGSRLALLMDTSLRFVETLHAAQKLAAVLVPLNTRLGTRELEALLQHADPQMLLFDTAYADKAAAAAKGAAGLRRLDALADFPLTGGEGDSLRVFDSCSKAHKVSGGYAPQGPDPSAAHCIIYTSGSSGRPKGVLLSNGNHQASARASRANLGYTQDECWLDCLPLYHIGGLSILLRSVIDGVSVLLQRGFDAATVNSALREFPVTHISLVPTMLERLLDESRERGRPRPAKLRCVLSGGASTGEALLRRAASAGWPVLPTYGLSEAASQVCTAEPGKALQRPGSCGRPLAGTQLKILAPGRDGYGEICVKGPSVASGYFKGGGFAGGWLHTGDIGRVDSDGYLYVVSRRSDLIVSGGENVYPSEVEELLRNHPELREVAVFGVDDRHWGQVVAAAVVPFPAGLRAVDELEQWARRLRLWCREGLAGYKIPKLIFVAESLPHTASGKIERRKLRDWPMREVLRISER